MVFVEPSPQLIEQTSIVYLWTLVNPWQNEGSKAWDPIPKCSMFQEYIYPAIAQ